MLKKVFDRFIQRSPIRLLMGVVVRKNCCLSRPISISWVMSLYFEPIEQRNMAIHTEILIHEQNLIDKIGYFNDKRYRIK